MSQSAACILIVDDNPALRRLLALTLRLSGYEVCEAGNGQEAFLVMEDKFPDVIVLDLQMPVMDGRTFFWRLAERPQRPPVIILSAYGAKTAYDELWAERFLTKPFEPQALVREVKMLLLSP